MNVDIGAKFFSERDNTSSWSDGTKEFENITGSHFNLVSAKINYKK